MNKPEIEMPHADAWDLLPWLANGTLEENEALSVRRHLERCARCREELGRCAALGEGIREIESLGPAPHPVQLERLWRRIEASDGADDGAPQPAARDALLRRRLGRWVSPTALTAAAALLLATGLVWVGAARPGASYHTLSAPATPASPGEIRVVFAENTTEAELRALVRGVGAEIVAGPSRLGVYTIRIGDGPDAGPVSWVVEQLRSHSAVRFAEPVAPTVP